jgi:hypothetical protein
VELWNKKFPPEGLMLLSLTPCSVPSRSQSSGISSGRLRRERYRHKSKHTAHRDRTGVLTFLLLNSFYLRFFTYFQCFHILLHTRFIFIIRIYPYCFHHLLFCLLIVSLYCFHHFLFCLLIVSLSFHNRWTCLFSQSRLVCYRHLTP